MQQNLIVTFTSHKLPNYYVSVVAIRPNCNFIVIITSMLFKRNITKEARLYCHTILNRSLWSSALSVIVSATADVLTRLLIMIAFCRWRVTTTKPLYDAILMGDARTRHRLLELRLAMLGRMLVHWCPVCYSVYLFTGWSKKLVTTDLQTKHTVKRPISETRFSSD